MKKRVMLGILSLLLLVAGGPAVFAYSTGDGLPGRNAQVPPLSETFEGLGLRVSYPAGWAAQERDGTIEIVNDAALFARASNQGGAPPLGGFALMILDPAQFAVYEMISLQGVIGMLAQGMRQNGQVIGTLDKTTVGDIPAVQITTFIPATNSDGIVSGHWLDDGSVLVAVALAQAGELGDYTATAAAILASITLAPDDGHFAGLGMTLTLPDEWQAAVYEGFIVIGNTATTLQSATAGSTIVMESGQTVLFVLGPFDRDEIELSLAELAAWYTDTMNARGYAIDTAALTEVTLGEDRAGVVMPVVQPDLGMEGEVFVFDGGDGARSIIVMAVAYTGEYDAPRDYVWDVIGSIVLQ